MTLYLFCYCYFFLFSGLLLGLSHALEIETRKDKGKITCRSVHSIHEGAYTSLVPDIKILVPWFFSLKSYRQFCNLQYFKNSDVVRNIKLKFIFLHFVYSRQKNKIAFKFLIGIYFPIRTTFNFTKQTKIQSTTEVKSLISL